jgi:hypothetical protein
MDFAQVFAIHQLEELYAQNWRNNRILLLALMEERRRMRERERPRERRPRSCWQRG